jgi:hypothetical protein
MAARGFQFDVKHGNRRPTWRQGKFVVLETEKNAVEHVAGFVGRDGIGSFAQAIVQILLADRDDFSVFTLAETLPGQAENFEKLCPLRMDAASFPSTLIEFRWKAAHERC